WREHRLDDPRANRRPAPYRGAFGGKAGRTRCRVWHPCANRDGNTQRKGSPMTIWFSRNIDWSRLLGRLAADRVRIKAGAALEDRDERAWTELYGRLLGLAWTFIDRPPALEERVDAVHDVMLKLYLHDGAFFRFQSSRKPSGYAVAMLRNAAADILRRYARSRAAALEALKPWNGSEP